MALICDSADRPALTKDEIEVTPEIVERGKDVPASFRDNLLFRDLG
jgi:hypothetical protein